MSATEQLFPLGQSVITPNAKSVLHPEVVANALSRHSHGDWGELCQHDREVNQQALITEGRLFSVYHDRNQTKFYIITEADRSVTTILLPEDY